MNQLQRINCVIYLRAAHAKLREKFVNEGRDFSVSCSQKVSVALFLFCNQIRGLLATSFVGRDQVYEDKSRYAWVKCLKIEIL